MSDHPMLPFEEPERWLPVVGYEGLYAVSDLGRVYSYKRNGTRGGVLKPTRPASTGYLVVMLRNVSRKTFAVHALAAAAFIGPRPAGLVTRHGPGGPLDNRLVNLSYGTVSQNALDRHRDGTMHLGEAHHQHKLTTAKVQAIRARVAAGERAILLAAEYGVSRPAINYIVNRKTWKHVA